MFDLNEFKAKREEAQNKGERWVCNADELNAAYEQGERDFNWANLSDANLRGANLRGTNLSDADLSGTDLRGTDLSDANLTHSCLDPLAEIPEGMADKVRAMFKVDDEGMAIGYRTRKSRYVGSNVYLDGEVYTAPWFSASKEMECHPGLYVGTMDEMQHPEYAGHEIIRVLFDPRKALIAGSKVRCKEFKVIGSVELPGERTQS